MIAIKDMQMPSCCGECQMASCKGLSGQFYCDITTYDIDMDDTRRDANCPLVEVEPLTDTEKRLFLSAVGREEDICKKIDSEKELKDLGVKELAPIVRSIRRKVKKALWA